MASSNEIGGPAVNGEIRRQDEPRATTAPQRGNVSLSGCEPLAGDAAPPIADDAHIAQLEERLLRKQRVGGSTPSVGFTIPAPQRRRPPDTFSTTGNLTWVDWSD